ncbi:hypothetical protein WBJ53_26260 [Spirosoma sp. SC4-14]|uniref:hypothetical protein n=1 Tax=Spirosoma sp. SC4-14 TaxID=3128900 RepID=UPI0030D45F28
MWNEVTILLGIKLDERDLDIHIAEVAACTAWLQANYGEKLTCEEVVAAYNLACQRILKIDELFSLLSPKHVGIVLAAYNNYLREDLEVNRVFAQQLLIESERKQTPEEITAFMENALELAKAEVREGKFYFDAGNGIFDWLYQNGRLTINDDQADYFYRKAKSALPKLLEREKSNTSIQEPGKRTQLERLIELAQIGEYGYDHHKRIEAYAKRLFLNDYLKRQLNEEAK